MIRPCSKMNSYLENRIRNAYPSGLLYELDEVAITNKERDARLWTVIDSCLKECKLECKVTLWSGLRYYEVVMTQKDHPSFNSQWVSRMTNEDKINWIKNNGPYPVFWLKVSRVDDYYIYHYNHWIPKGDTGYLDAKCDIQPNQIWLGYECFIKTELEKFGFKFLTVELASERVSFVLESESIPHDDPRWDDDDFEPPLVTSDVYECLFHI